VATKVLGAVVGVLALAIGWMAWAGLVTPPTSAAAAATPAEALQQQLLKDNVGRPGDPILGAMFQDLNAKHFSSALPAMPVMWEPGLGRVGDLAGHTFTLEGMFGHVRKQSLILLNPNLQANQPALARALSHEMVHAYLFVTGDDRTDHGPAFQSVLKRLSKEGAFEGILASDEERESLKSWLDAESARLDAEQQEMTRLSEEIERERREVEQLMADLEARVRAGTTQGSAAPSDVELDAATARRLAYNDRATDANTRASRDRAALEHFNNEVARYNLMLVYPDGVDARALLKPRSTPMRASGQ
jgi:SprT-like family protein